MKIVIRKISKSFDKLKVLDNLNLIVENNTFLMITGKSGCGKTTLLKCMLGEENLDEGEIYFNSYSISKNRDYLISKKIGYVKQDNELIDELTCFQLIKLSANITNTEWDQEWFENICKILQIEDLLKKRGKSCSTGEKQRVSLACALIKKPEVLLLDEPTGNLDKANTEHFMSLLMQLKEVMTCTIVMVTHETSLYHYANRVISLKQCHMNELEEVEEEVKVEYSSNIKWIPPFIEQFYKYHFMNTLIVTICIASVFLACYIALNAGDRFKNYVYEKALTMENSQIIHISSDTLIPYEEIKKFEEIEHIESIKEKDNRLLYGFQRDTEHPISITIGTKTMSDNDSSNFEAINFHGFENKLIAGTKECSGTDLVVSKGILDHMGVSVDEALGTSITYRVPYIVGLADIIKYDEFYQITYLGENAVFESIELEGKIVGIIDTEYYDILHNSEVISKMINQEIANHQPPNHMLSPYSSKECELYVDNVLNVSECLKQLRNMGYTCENPAEYLINNISNIDRLSDIYHFSSFLYITVVLFAFVIVISYMNQIKLKTISQIKKLGANTKQIKYYLLIDGFIFFIFTGCISMLLTRLLLPLINHLFSYLNSMILYLQFAANNGTMMFHLSYFHLFLGCVAILCLIVLSSFSLFYNCRRKELC